MVLIRDLKKILAYYLLIYTSVCRQSFNSFSVSGEYGAILTNLKTFLNVKNDKKLARTSFPLNETKVMMLQKYSQF